jgi:mRNA interferase RelE/StbE
MSKGSALKGFWKYRVGDYRIISHIHDQKITILIVKIGHRMHVYK